MILDFNPLNFILKVFLIHVELVQVVTFSCYCKLNKYNLQLFHFPVIMAVNIVTKYTTVLLTTPAICSGCHKSQHVFSVLYILILLQLFNRFFVANTIFNLKKDL